MKHMVVEPRGNDPGNGLYILCLCDTISLGVSPDIHDVMSGILAMIREVLPIEIC